MLYRRLFCRCSVRSTTMWSSAIDRQSRFLKETHAIVASIRRVVKKKINNNYKNTTRQMFFFYVLVAGRAGEGLGQEPKTRFEVYCRADRKSRVQRRLPRRVGKTWRISWDIVVRRHEVCARVYYTLTRNGKYFLHACIDIWQPSTGRNQRQLTVHIIRSKW